MVPQAGEKLRILIANVWYEIGIITHAKEMMENKKLNMIPRFSRPFHGHNYERSNMQSPAKPDNAS